MARRGGSGLLILVGLIGALIWRGADEEHVSKSAPTAPTSRNVVIAPKPTLPFQPPADLPRKAAPAKPQAPNPRPVLLYTTANVRLRAQPSTAAPTLRTLSAGEVVESVERAGVWHHVRASDGGEGWVHGDYLGDARPAAPPAGGLGATPADCTSARSLRRACPRAIRRHLRLSLRPDEERTPVWRKQRVEPAGRPIAGVLCRRIA
jgi:hypothetical protein